MQLSNFYMLVSLSFVIIFVHVYIVTLPRNKWDAILSMFYKTIHCIRPIPNSSLATVVIANHPNAFIDPFAIEAALDVKLVRTVRADWTKHWLVRWFTYALGAVPLASQRNNSQSFHHLIKTLNSGKAVILFPEGQSHNQSNLKPFKKGAAHLVKRYIEETGKPIRVVKVALYYENKSQLNSDIWVDVIDQSIYSQTQFNVDEQTKLWQQQINDALPSYHRTADKQQVNCALQTIYAINPLLLTSLDILKATSNSQMTRLQRWLARAQYNLSALEANHSILGHLCKAIAHCCVFISGLPILILGVISNAPAAILHYAITSNQSSAEDKWASNAFILGLTIYPIYWLIIGLLSAPIIALIVMFTGFYANFFVQTWGDRKRMLITHFGCISQPKTCEIIRSIANDTLEIQPVSRLKI